MQAICCPESWQPNNERGARTSAGYGRFRILQQNSRGVSALLRTGCATGECEKSELPDRIVARTR